MHILQYNLFTGVFMIFDWQTAERMQCGQKDKIQLVPLIDLLVQSSEKARREGLLALEDDIGEYEYPLLKAGMQLVVDGTDPEIIEKLLSIRMLSGNRRGKEFVEQLIIYTGLLSIQSGDNPRITMEKCFALLGDDSDQLRARYIAETVEGRESNSAENYSESDGALAEFFAKTGKLVSFDDRAIQKVLREIDTTELAGALHGCDKNVRKKILQNMSKRAAYLIVDVQGQIIPDPGVVGAHITRLFEIIARLEEDGEIVVPS